MKKKLLSVMFLFFGQLLFAGGTTDKFSLKEQQAINPAVTVMSGVFNADDHNILSTKKIIVKNSRTGEVVGLYKPNKNTGKYLFILVSGETYDVDFELDGKILKSVNLIVPASTSFDKTYTSINVGML